MKLDGEEYVHAIRNGVCDCYVGLCYGGWDEIGLACTNLEALIGDTTATLHNPTRELLSREIKQQMLNIMASVYKVTKKEEK